MTEVNASSLVEADGTWASEAIAVVDIVESTATTDLFGWYAVGRSLFRELRQMILAIGGEHGLCCMKSTGDGFLLGYANTEAADLAAIDAVKASLELLKQLTERNSAVPEQRRIHIRVGIHFGEIDVLPGDREGPNVSYAFRIGSITQVSLPFALNPIEPRQFPLRDYLLCSESVCQIIAKHKGPWNLANCGLFKLKGFSGHWEVFLVATPRTIPAP